MAAVTASPAFSADIELNYKEYGSGAPLILLHGNGEDMNYFVKQTPVFAEHFRVITVDTRGHGSSPRGTAPFTLSQFADDLKYFMDAHSIDRANILGFSDGANIALLFALRYPERVEKLVLNGADLTTAGVRPTTQIPIVIGYGLLCFFALLSKSVVSKKEMLALMVTQPHITTDELKGLKMPVLVIAGTSDMIKTSHTRLIAQSIEGSTLCLMNGDHFIAAKHSEKFNTAVLNFLDGAN